MLIKTLCQIIQKNKDKIDSIDFDKTKTLQKKEKLNNNKESNRLYIGDNKDAMLSLLKEKIKLDLIYVDPPYNSNAKYYSKISLKAANNKNIRLEALAYTDVWENGVLGYLDALCERLFLMHRLLKKNGSIYVHLDWHMVHYVKIIMDEIFGIENFVNEIIWQRTGAQNNAATYGTNYDSILFYKKSKNKIWNRQKIDFTPEELKKYYKKDEKGEYYRLNNPTGKGYQDHTRDFGKGPVYPPAGRHWSISQNEVDALLKSNKIVFTSSGYPFIKKYLSEIGGKNLQAIWIDCIPPRKSKELTGYATQKPEKLLERIIKASTNENSLVGDFYAGSGTTLAVAKKLNRRWIASESELLGAHVLKKRLLGLSSSVEIYEETNKKNHKISLDNNCLSLTNYPLTVDLCLHLKKKKITVNALKYPKENVFSMSKKDFQTFTHTVKNNPKITLDLIQLDLNYDGKVFKPSINIYQNLNNKSEITWTNKTAQLTALNIAVKITDIFGLSVFHYWVIE